MSELQRSLFQDSVLLCPEVYDLFLGGGRGGAKSWALAWLALRHGEQYQSLARALYLRPTYKGALEMEDITRDLFGAVYGSAAKFNSHEHLWRLPGGGHLEIGQLEGPGDYAKFQGRSFRLIMIDEAGQYPDPTILDKLRSNLRGPADVPIRMALAANPGDVGHHWLASRYALRGAPWHPFYEQKSGREWVSCPSTYLDNPFIDQEAYRRQLAASCPGDPELLNAWLTGDWSIVRGAFFADCLSETRNQIEPWDALPEPWSRRDMHWRYFISMDFGFDAPSVVYLVAASPGALMPDGRYAPKGSLILFDELATNLPGELNTGLRWPIEKQAGAIHALCEPWKIPPVGCADDACFAEAGSLGGSLARQFGTYGVRLSRAGKGLRAPGWMLMRQLLVDAGKPDKPGMFISSRCAYFWSTVPYLPRDPRIANDCDSRGPDHAADCARYACVYKPEQMRAVKVTGI
jgi:Terminase large subunit, T4likevirus-type, N-terminal